MTRGDIIEWLLYVCPTSYRESTQRLYDRISDKELEKEYNTKMGFTTSTMACEVVEGDHRLWPIPDPSESTVAMDGFYYTMSKVGYVWFKNHKIIKEGDEYRVEGHYEKRVYKTLTGAVKALHELRKTGRIFSGG